MARKKQFKAESKRLLDLMINSIYTHKEIFLRELISNASDAIDKLYYKSLSENLSDIDQNAFKIHLEIDKENRTLSISDNGLGMNKEELEENLGTIAKSGSFAFKQELEEKDEKEDAVDIIGQFGVGFYSAFMVANRVDVVSKKYGEETAYIWSSDASDGYTIEETSKDDCGTTITLYLKDNTDDENYDEYLAQYEIERLIKKYSDYIRYPIEMWVEEQKRIEPEDGEEQKPEDVKYETVKELKTLNSMIPLWKRSKNEITKEEYNDFYKSKFNDFTDPQKTIHFSVEGNVSFTSLLFIPGKAPMNYYSQDYKKGLQLYSRGVFIMDNADELIPEHFRFVKGLVDSQDLNLNISREMLQHDRQLKVIANRIEKKIKSELLLMLKNDREEYEKFWNTFGLQIKFGVYNGFGANKELLQDLLLFYSSKEQKLITLDEYVARMEEGQENIYFMSGEKIEKIDQMPAVQKVKDKGYEILYLTDNVDEFVLQILGTFKEKNFKNISQGDLDLDSEEEKKELEKKAEENKDMLEGLKTALGEKVKEVKISTRLVDDPVCLSSDEGMSFEMEKVLSAMPEGNPYGMKASRILEINPNHPIFEALQKVYAEDKDAVKEYADLLFDQALLIEGFPIDNPAEFSKKICEFMVRATK
ncbi:MULTISPECIES: molecular chaperone HtpG [Bacillota]|jgi:molecular chaperone HtpG|uniref:Chaperone protein HtpG n=2 Tax=Amedibacillus TaxID=2749846 RepID=A0A7G9GKJ3_9FIRM|nr:MULTISPECIES: molecular chaperone HtpG [Bacillota]QNM11325.1 molecular chaperone HtpG [[Eubacterium] hominis]MCH4284671.1 molecular chaperone HtpG [Amedibacillus hominis]RGB49650.1 molecular chaperone HtpG [Absiella sp. AM22-9]RGB60302.1 molecular chaperone HtpG [Absiella sp. AM10-20]RGB68170.1 molecular chaperone HtpG [Absiella sp. AM09-45]